MKVPKKREQNLLVSVVVQLTDWTKVRCTKCEHHYKCRKKAVAKGSKLCLLALGRIKPKEISKTPDESQKLTAMLLRLFGRNKGKKK